MLQACEGAMLSESQAFVGVASRVVQQNIPVVVAMQYEVSNATASRFACKFYKRLAQGAPVDIAVQEGRYAIALSATQYRKRDFAAPVIFMRVQDGYLFKSEDNSTPLNNIEKTPQPQNDGNYQLLLEKLNQFRRDRYITADLARQFELDKQIEEIQQQLDNIGFRYQTESIIDNKPKSETSSFVNMNPSQRKQFREALMDAFPRKMNLEIMLSEELEWNLYEIVGEGNNADIIFELIKYAESQGNLVELLEAAKRANPGNPKLRNFYL